MNKYIYIYSGSFRIYICWVGEGGFSFMEGKKKKKKDWFEMWKFFFFEGFVGFWVIDMKLRCCV